MIRIGIELDNVLRNKNKQILKYYQRDIDPLLDIEALEGEENIFDKYDFFDSEKAKRKFLYIDYPYEIFGCAEPMSKNLATQLNNWMEDIKNDEDNRYIVGIFGLMEEAIAMQSSYFFLSKCGFRVRSAYFPDENTEMDELWNNFDIIITNNEEICKSKPKEKVSVLIGKNKQSGISDFMYSSMSEALSDVEFLDKIVEKFKGNERK